MTNLGTIVGNNLKRLRGDLSQSDFAESIGIGARTYQRYESGERIAPDEVISEVLVKYKVSLEYLLMTEEKELKSPNEPVSILAKKLLNIPDYIYESAVNVGPDDEIWKSIKQILDKKGETKSSLKASV